MREIELRRLARIGQHALLEIEEGDDVDVGRVVELAPAMLAEREDREPARSRQCVAGEPCRPGGQPHQHLEPGIERRIGEIGQRRRRLRRGPAPGDLGHRGQQCDPPLGDAQHRADLVLGLRRAPPNISASTPVSAASGSPATR